MDYLYHYPTLTIGLVIQIIHVIVELLTTGLVIQIIHVMAETLTIGLVIQIIHVIGSQCFDNDMDYLYH
jgi:hypothetical protein